MKRLYFETLGGVYFGLRIRAALNDNKEARNYIEPSPRTMELAAHIYYRLNMASRSVERINILWSKTQEIVKTNMKEDHVFTDDKDGYAFRLDRKIEDDLRLDIDSFLFETNSCCELIREYFERLSTELNLYDEECDYVKYVMKVSRDNGIDMTWFRLLDSLRNYFIHKATINIAIKLPNDDGDTYELIIMKKFLRSFEDKTEYLYLHELNAILHGLWSMLPLIEDNLISDINRRFDVV